MTRYRRPPNSSTFVFQRLLMLFVYLFVEITGFIFFINPYYQGEKKHPVIFTCFLVYWIFISLMWIISYYYVSWQDAGSIDAEISILHEDISELLKEMPRCKKCGSVKPERVHHCSQCGLCYVRFDHHCPTVGNCIAYHNAQPFALYLTYGSIILFSYGLMNCLSRLFGSYLNSGLARSFGLLVIFLSLALSFFAYITLSALLDDRTTLERLYRIKISGKDIPKTDFTPIWGKNKFMWIIPHPPVINGLYWINAIQKQPPVL